jgi:hypothetical protein
MGLDVRVPVGLLFSAIGLALIAYGFLSDPRIYAKSLGVNVNLWWGLVLLVFGVVMLLFGWTDRVAPKSPHDPSARAKAGEPVAR